MGRLVGITNTWQPRASYAGVLHAMKIGPGTLPTTAKCSEATAERLWLKNAPVGCRSKIEKSGTRPHPNLV